MRRLGELAALTDALIVGDSDALIGDARVIRNANSNHLTFATNEKHLQQFLDSPAAAAVVGEDWDADQLRQFGEKSFLICNDVESCFAAIVKIFRPSRIETRIGISERAVVASSAEIAEDVDLYPGCYVGENVKIGCGSKVYPNATIMDGVQVGADTTIFPNVTIYENCIIGHRCILHAGATIGAYGFGYKSGHKHDLSEQLGNVLIEDDVEIGANATIDRGTFDSTVIGRGTKIDNLVMIGHNCVVGRHNLLCSQVGIAGSSATGDYVVMAGQVGIGDHLEIGTKATIAAQSGVMHNLPGDQVYLGSPAIAAREQMQIHAVSAKLPEMRKQLKRIQKAMEAVESKLGDSRLSAAQSAKGAA